MAEIISERVQMDRMWRDPERRKSFEQETGLTDANTQDYHERFRAWASVRLEYRGGRLGKLEG